MVDIYSTSVLRKIGGVDKGNLEIFIFTCKEIFFFLDTWKPSQEVHQNQVVRCGRNGDRHPEFLG